MVKSRDQFSGQYYSLCQGFSLKSLVSVSILLSRIRSRLRCASWAVSFSIAVTVRHFGRVLRPGMAPEQLLLDILDTSDAPDRFVEATETRHRVEGSRYRVEGRSTGGGLAPPRGGSRHRVEGWRHRVEGSNHHVEGWRHSFEGRGTAWRGRGRRGGLASPRGGVADDANGNAADDGRRVTPDAACPHPLPRHRRRDVHSDHAVEAAGEPL